MVLIILRLLDDGQGPAGANMAALDGYPEP